MKRYLNCAIAVGLVALIHSIAPPPRLSANEGLNDVTLRDIYGFEHQLTSFLEDPAEAVVLVFMDPDCPVVRQYAPRLREMHEHYNGFQRDRTGTPVRIDESGREVAYDYAGDRVLFIGVYSMPEISVKAMASHAVDAMIPFRVLQDHRQAMMNHVSATELGEVVVMDRHGAIQYQGTIDDQFFPGGAKPRPTEHYLRDAIDAVLNGGDIAVKKRPPQGCVITRRESKPPESTVTFHRDIVPILQKRCQQCHRDGEVGPMPLEFYDDVFDYSEMVQEVILDERMPPWPGESPLKFADDERLTADEKQTLIDWFRSGMQQGDPADAPPAIEWPERGEWTIGEPDLIVEMPESFVVPATGFIDYVYYPVKLELPKDKYIRSIETIPGAPSVVHHIQVHEFHGSVKETGATGLSPLEQLFVYGPSIEGARLLAGYTPGNNQNARIYGSNRGMKLPAGANLLMEMHYTTNGTATPDRSKVGIIFSDEPPERELKTHFYFRKRGDFIIPSNVHHHSMQHLYHFETDVRVMAIRPHMHARGKSYRLEKVKSADIRLSDIHDIDNHWKPRGETILTIPVWDFNWQRTYSYAEPMIVRKGEALLATGFWDNSKHNPRNPNWRENVPWGQQTEQEMFNTLFLYEELDPNDPLLADESN